MASAAGLGRSGAGRELFKGLSSSLAAFHFGAAGTHRENFRASLALDDVHPDVVRTTTVYEDVSVHVAASEPEGAHDRKEYR